MAKVLYSATMSLDGFIAGARGDMSWMTEYLGDLGPAGAEVARATGSILAGRTTFGGDDPNRGTDAEGPFGGTWSGPTFVLTHRAPAEPVAGITFVGELYEAVAAAKEAAGDKYVNVLGADVARQCLEAGLLDEILMFVAPILLGDGCRVFDHPGGTRVKLDRLRDDQLWYRVVR
jgi:dihydrofolate reductase